MSVFSPISKLSHRITAKIMRPVTNKILNEIRISTKKVLNEVCNSRNAVLMSTRDSNTIPYYSGEKIRILFLFQMASIWPSWESFYESCINDPRFEVVFTLLKEDNPVSMSQMLSAESFLKSKGIPYVIFNDTILAQTQPHVVVIQTPYDWYRQKHVKSTILQRYGTRVIYITYGIEIADTEHAHRDHYKTAVRNCWRIYTFSDRMRADYATYCFNGIAARSFGHPKFDALYHKDKFKLPETAQKKANGRKIVLWHFHFPKFIKLEDGSQAMATPYLDEYLSFVKTIESSEDLFFIAQIHPKFLDCEEPLLTQTKQLIEELEKLSNVYIDKDDDYRPCLVNADYIITDRSAIMVEGATVGVPIQYMSNADYSEPLTEAVRPLIESYVQGHTAADMVAFVEDCRKGLDTQKEVREKAFHECIPYFDGLCGERIKNDIALSLMSPVQVQIDSMNMNGINTRDSVFVTNARTQKDHVEILDVLDNPNSVQEMDNNDIELLKNELVKYEERIHEVREIIDSLSNDNK